MWGVKSDDVNLGEHVGHVVTVSGAVKEKIEKNPNEHGDMTVTNLKMISKSCEK
jgi:hypothetical protein